MSQLYTQSQAAALHAACNAVRADRFNAMLKAPTIAAIDAALDACKPSPYVRRPNEQRGPHNNSTLTKRQAEVVAFIKAFHYAHGVSPSVRDICAALDIRSHNGVTAHLKAIARKGYLTRTPHIARGIRLLEPANA